MALLLLPILTFLALSAYEIGSLKSVRESAVRAAILCAVFVALVTEALSAFNALSPLLITEAWLSAFLVLILMGQKRLTTLKGLVKQRENLVRRFRAQGVMGCVLIVVVLSLVLVLGVLALYAPITNPDSLAYHIPRVEYWLQHRNVAHFPAHILRQLYNPPWSSFALLHLTALAHSDQYDNLIQFTFMVLSLLAVSLLARELDLPPLGEIFAAFICLLIPMGIAQSTTTQNDYILSFWIVCFAFFALKLRKSNSLELYGLAGCCLGLSLLTKGTAWLFSAPIVFAITVSAGARRSRLDGLGVVALAGIVIALNAAPWFRNASLFGSPLGPSRVATNARDFSPQEDYRTEEISSRILASNIVRNTLNHFWISPSTNDRVYRFVDSAHRLLGISINDPKSTFNETSFQIQIEPSRNDYSAQNPIHFTLAVGLIIRLFFSRRHWSWTPPLGAKHTAFLLCLWSMSGFLLFCLLLKWQPWHSRLELPIFVLMSAPIAWALTHSKKRLWLLQIVSLSLLIQSLPMVFSQPLLPVAGTRNIFTNPALSFYPHDYFLAAKFITEQHARNIGIISSYSNDTYPIWAWFRVLDGSQSFAFENVNVRNSSGVLTNSSFNVQPDAIVVFKEHLPPDEYRFMDFQLGLDLATMAVLVPPVDRR